MLNIQARKLGVARGARRFAAVLCDAKTDELLGAHIVGYNATEIIHELLPEDIANLIYAHPTISEAVMETLRGINDKPIHA